jgi:hypothetical protein
LRFQNYNLVKEHKTNKQSIHLNTEQNNSAKKDRNVKKKRKMSRVWLIPMVSHALFFFHSIEQQQKKIEPFFHELFHSARNNIKK